MPKKNKPRWKDLNMWERLAKRCKRNGTSKKPLNTLESMENREGKKAIIIYHEQKRNICM